MKVADEKILSSIQCKIKQPSNELRFSLDIVKSDIKSLPKNGTLNNATSVPRNFADFGNLYKNLKVGHYEHLSEKY